jgi:hypothetical protein
MPYPIIIAPRIMLETLQGKVASTPRSGKKEKVGKMKKVLTMMLAVISVNEKIQCL